MRCDVLIGHEFIRDHQSTRREGSTVPEPATSRTVQTLEHAVKQLLIQQGLSMRGLASKSGLDVATVSRILAGKQRPKPTHLKRIAQAFNVAEDSLLEAAGLTNAGAKVESPVDTSTEIMTTVLQHPDFAKWTFTKSDIEHELVKCEHYATTAEGITLIKEKFPDKRGQISGSGPFLDYLDEIYKRFEQGGTLAEMSILGSGLLYFVLSTDTIPDDLFPIGFLDDAVAIQITWNRYAQLQRTVCKHL